MHFQAVLGFVCDGLFGWLLFHIDGEAAALNHETGNDTVENRVRIEIIFGVGEEIRGGNRRLFLIQFDDNATQAGLHLYLGASPGSH